MRWHRVALMCTFFKFKVLCGDPSIYYTRFLLIQKYFCPIYKIFPNPNISRALIRRVLLSESKAFSMSIVFKYPFTFMFLVTLSKSEVIVLIHKYTLCSIRGLLRWDNIWKYFFQSGSRNFRNNFIIYIK